MACSRHGPGGEDFDLQGIPQVGIKEQPLLADAVAGCLLFLHLDVTVAVRGIQPFGLDAVRCNSNIGVSRAARQVLDFLDDGFHLHDRDVLYAKVRLATQKCKAEDFLMDSAEAARGSIGRTV